MNINRSISLTHRTFAIPDSFCLSNYGIKRYLLGYPANLISFIAFFTTVFLVTVLNSSK